MSHIYHYYQFYSRVLILIYVLIASVSTKLNKCQVSYTVFLIYVKTSTVPVLTLNINLPALLTNMSIPDGTSDAMVLNKWSMLALFSRSHSKKRASLPNLNVNKCNLICDRKELCGFYLYFNKTPAHVGAVIMKNSTKNEPPRISMTRHIC